MQIQVLLDLRNFKSLDFKKLISLALMWTCGSVNKLDNYSSVIGLDLTARVLLGEVARQQLVEVVQVEVEGGDW
jgi:hypothetical protein